MNENEVKKIFGIKERKQRSSLQNNALHLAFGLLAGSLNDSGLDMKKVLTIDIPWTVTAVKEYLYRPVMKAMLAKESTTELDSKEISDVWEVLMRELGREKGVENIPFPSEEQTQEYLKSLLKSNPIK